MIHCDHINCPKLNCLRNYKEQYRLAPQPMRASPLYYDNCIWIDKEVDGKPEDLKNDRQSDDTNSN